MGIICMSSLDVPSTGGRRITSITPHSQLSVSATPEAHGRGVGGAPALQGEPRAQGG